MENATQALRIAAGILMALLILGVIVVFYNNIREYNQYKEDLTYQEQATDFNKQYNTYMRTLYGSELLSLVNKADNYNEMELEDGYQKIEVIVIFKNNIAEFKKNKEYNINGIKSVMNSLENNIKIYGSKKYGGKTISELSLMRTKELQNFLEKQKIVNKKDVEKDIQLYTSYKADEVTIKSKKYEFKNVIYDSLTGRITKLTYKEL